MSSDSNPQEKKVELTPEEARIVIKAIEEAERKEAAEQEERMSRSK